MRDYLSKTGLSYFYNRIKTLFASKTEFNTLKGQVDELVAEGGEPNVIETVKVNGTALTPAAKAVDITVPTKTSELTNNGDGDSPFATEEYVSENGGKIDKIKVNGTEQTITNKEVNISVPRFTTADSQTGYTTRAIIQNDSANDGIMFDIVNDGVSIKFGEGRASAAATRTIDVPDKTYVNNTFRTEAQVQAAIDAALADVTSIEYQIVDTLPATGAKGIIYLISTGTPSAPSYDEYIWLTPEGGTAHYEKIGTTDVDLSGYWSKAELAAITTAEIDEILA